jgi:hypothetical protein
MVMMRNRPVRQRSSSTPVATPIEPVPVPTHPPPQESTGASNDTASEDYSSKVVRFLKQDDIFTILASRYEGDISRSLRRKIEEIREGGVPRLERLQSEEEEMYFELAIILSLFEEDINHQLFLQPPPPPVQDTTSSSTDSVTNRPSVAPTIDIDATEYMGIPLDIIVYFFQSQNIHQTVLSRFGRIDPEMRTFIQALSSTLCIREICEELYSNPEARNFVL